MKYAVVDWNLSDERIEICFRASETAELIWVKFSEMDLLQLTRQVHLLRLKSDAGFEFSGNACVQTTGYNPVLKDIPDTLMQDPLVEFMSHLVHVTFDKPFDNLEEIALRRLFKPFGLAIGLQSIDVRPEDRERAEPYLNALHTMHVAPAQQPEAAQDWSMAQVALCLGATAYAYQMWLHKKPMVVREILLEVLMLPAKTAAQAGAVVGWTLQSVANIGRSQIRPR